MAKFVFKRDQIGTVYGVLNAREGVEVELDAAFAADGVAQGLLAPVEVEKPAKRGPARKAE